MPEECSNLVYSTMLIPCMQKQLAKWCCAMIG